MVLELGLHQVAVQVRWLLSGGVRGRFHCSVVSCQFQVVLVCWWSDSEVRI